MIDGAESGTGGRWKPRAWGSRSPATASSPTRATGVSTPSAVSASIGRLGQLPRALRRIAASPPARHSASGSAVVTTSPRPRRSSQARSQRSRCAELGGLRCAATDCARMRAVEGSVLRLSCRSTIVEARTKALSSLGSPAPRTTSADDAVASKGLPWILTRTDSASQPRWPSIPRPRRTRRRRPGLRASAPPRTSRPAPARSTGPHPAAAKRRQRRQAHQ